jgi:hypothetical protein
VQWSSTAGEAVPRLRTEAHGSDETGSQRGSFRLSPLSSDLLNEIAPADAVALVQQARAAAAAAALEQCRRRCGGEKGPPQPLGHAVRSGHGCHPH